MNLSLSFVVNVRLNAYLKRNLFIDLTGCFLSTFKQISDAQDKLVIVFKWQQVILKQNTECATIFRKKDGFAGASEEMGPNPIEMENIVG